MENAYRKLSDRGKNNADSLIRWMKEAKIIKNKRAEKKCRRLLKDARNGRIELHQFNEILAQTAQEFQQDPELYRQRLLETSERFLNALRAGAAAFQVYQEEHSDEEEESERTQAKRES
ncbi:hypothetical protein JYU34_006195 [Plutella xylostella]|uniref:CRISPR type III A-associated protein Csm2 n=1 Tax=Plutella xylostella TaxID=51655 RepID=A0ABQ7QV90_PLUXY|nr:uncharacterized protein LOC105388808 [Plutella xylostella]KAG7308924.1 hypothetical protein JYU34_006195 [Plutella xylostella]